MRKLFLVLILAGFVLAQPISPEPVIDKVMKKLDKETLEVTTTTTVVRRVVHDRAVLQTELDHIPDRRAEVMKQLDAINEREAELIAMLKVLE